MVNLINKFEVWNSPYHPVSKYPNSNNKYTTLLTQPYRSSNYHPITNFHFTNILHFYIFFWHFIPPTYGFVSQNLSLTLKIGGWKDQKIQQNEPYNICQILSHEATKIFDIQAF